MEIKKTKYNSQFIEYLQNEFPTNGKNLIVIGKPGVGKTFLCRNLIKHDYFIGEPTFRQCIVNGTCVLKKPEEFSFDTNLFPLEALSRKKTVIFDDYGKGALTDAYLEKMYYRLSIREEKKLRTITTTNLVSMVEFKKRDEGLADRFMKNAHIYVCDGRKDLRIKNTKILNNIFK